MLVDLKNKKEKLIIDCKKVKDFDQFRGGNAKVIVVKNYKHLKKSKLKRIINNILIPKVALCRGVIILT